jgi:hypothetical protein
MGGGREYNILAQKFSLDAMACEIGLKASQPTHR